MFKTISQPTFADALEQQSYEQACNALSSGKKDLALFIANEAMQLGRRDSGSAILYTFGDQEGFHAVEQIFRQAQGAPLTPVRDSQGRTSPAQGDAHRMTSSGLYKSGL